MGNAKKGSAAPRRAPQHRTSVGRHRQPAPTVAELTDLPATAGAKIAVAGVVGTSAALATPVIGLAGQADASVAHTATAQPGTIGGPGRSGNISIPPGALTSPAPAAQVPKAVGSPLSPAAPGQPIADPVGVETPSGRNYLVPTNPGNVFSVPVGTTLTLSDGSSFTLSQPGTENTVFGRVTVLPAGQAVAEGSGIPVLTANSNTLSLPPGAGNSFIVPPDSIVGPSAVPLSQGTTVQRGAGVTVTAQPDPGLETAQLPNGPVIPLGTGFMYVLPPTSVLTSQDNVPSDLPPNLGGRMRMPSGITVQTGPSALPFSVPIQAPEGLPRKPPGNLSDAGTGLPDLGSAGPSTEGQAGAQQGAQQDGSQQPADPSLLDQLGQGQLGDPSQLDQLGQGQLGDPSQQPQGEDSAQPPVVLASGGVIRIQPVSPAPSIGSRGSGSNGQGGKSDFERILDEAIKRRGELPQDSQKLADSSQQGQDQQGQDPQNQDNQDQQQPFSNPGDPTIQDPGSNTQVAANSGQSRSANSVSANSPVSASPQSTQVAANSGASSSGFGDGFTNAGTSSGGGFSIASGGSGSSGGGSSIGSA